MPDPHVPLAVAGSAGSAVSDGTSSTGAARNDLSVLEDTLQGLRAWREISADTRAEARRIGGASREARMDAQRRLKALQRSQDALMAGLDSTLEAFVGVLGRGESTALVAHRNAWMRSKLVDGLTGHGLVVVAEVEDGADGLGALVAEQPDLLVAEDLLPSVDGVELARHARRLAPCTLVSVQVADAATADVMVAAGARAVFSRRVPPARLCEEVASLLLRVDSEPPLVLL